MTSPLDWNAGGYADQKIAGELRQRIRSGRYPPHTLLPRGEIEREFGVSHYTVSKAFAQLRGERLIYLRNGVGGGNFVSDL